MSDETLHPDPDRDGETLASLYVDGLTSAPERAQVESSPQLMGLAQQFRDQRDALAVVPPPAGAAREAAVAAALASFSMVEPPPNVVSIDRRRHTRWLTAAAAVMLLGVGGVVVANLSTGDSDLSATKVQNAAVDNGTERNGTPEFAAGTLAGDAITTGDTSDVTASGVGGGGAPPTATIGSINGPSSAVPEVRTQEALRTTATSATAEADVQPSFELGCTLDTSQQIVAEITWKGTPAVVVRDTVTGVITALDAQCTALATVAP